MKLALIISTYNRPDALELCLKSIATQVMLPHEILIADDGSTSETRRVIDRYKAILQINVVHVWHEDNGFELAKIRNKAIAQSTADYIVQIDGDLILHDCFIKDHYDFALPKSFVRASRIYMDKDLTESKIENMDTSINRFHKGISNFMSTFRVPFLWRFFATNYKINGAELWEIHGCNMAYWRSDALKVNGYNEDFIGWGPEDKEFIARLLNIGLKKRFLKLGAIVYHMWHSINPKENLSSNMLIFEETKLLKRTYCENGIDKYLNKI